MVDIMRRYFFSFDVEVRNGQSYIKQTSSRD